MDTQSTTSQNAVLIVSSNWIYRRGLNHVILERTHYESVLEAEDCTSALVCLAGEHRIEFLFADLQSTDCFARGHLADLLAAAGDIPIIVMSANPTLGDALAAFETGAAGYIDTCATADEILSTVKAVERGLIRLSRSMLDQKTPCAAAGRNIVLASPTNKMLASLTPRQGEILGELGKGRSNRDIAAELQISINTVKIHVGAILGLLGVRSRTQAALLLQSGSLD